MDSLRNLWKRSNQIMPLLAGASFVLIVGVTSIALLCNGAVNPAEGETCAQCVREWIGALSGWAAGIAAAITGVIILSQVQVMKEQLREQTIQTNHITGRLPPIIEFNEIDRNECYTEIVIRNQGNKNITIKRLRIVEPSSITFAEGLGRLFPPDKKDYKREIYSRPYTLEPHEKGEEKNIRVMSITFRKIGNTFSGKVNISLEYYFNDTPDETEFVDGAITF